EQVGSRSLAVVLWHRARRGNHRRAEGGFGIKWERGRPPAKSSDRQLSGQAARASKKSFAVPASCTISVKAIPNAPRNEIVGWLGEALKVKVHAPPLEGRANDELCEFLADTLGLPRRAVTLVRG